MAVRLYINNNNKIKKNKKWGRRRFTDYRQAQKILTNGGRSEMECINNAPDATAYSPFASVTIHPSFWGKIYLELVGPNNTNIHYFLFMMSTNCHRCIAGASLDTLEP